MNAPATIQTPLAVLARQILAEPPVSTLYVAAHADQRDRKDAAQGFLDSGYPDELLEVLAEQEAREEADNRSEILNQPWFYRPRSIWDDADAAYDEMRERGAL